MKYGAQIKVFYCVGLNDNEIVCGNGSFFSELSAGIDLILLNWKSIKNQPHSVCANVTIIKCPHKTDEEKTNNTWTEGMFHLLLYDCNKLHCGTGQSVCTQC